MKGPKSWRRPVNEVPRVRPHFKAHTSISHHRMMSEIYPSNDLLSLWLRLGILAIDRYAAKAQDTVRIHRNELSALTGGKRRDKAEETLRLLASKLQLTLKKDGDYFQVQWRNLSKKQGFGDNNGTETSNADADANTNAEAQVTMPGGMLAPDFVEKLRQIRPGGVLYSAQQVQDWFLQKQPQMEARGVKNFRRAASNWFERASRPEMDSATRWVRVQKANELRDKPKQEDEKDSLKDFKNLFESKGGDS